MPRQKMRAAIARFWEPTVVLWLRMRERERKQANQKAVVAHFARKEAKKRRQYREVVRRDVQAKPQAQRAREAEQIKQALRQYRETLRKAVLTQRCIDRAKQREARHIAQTQRLGIDAADLAWMAHYRARWEQRQSRQRAHA